MNTHTTKRRESASERGAGLAEYALLVSLIAFVAIGAITTLGVTIATMLGSAAAMF